MNQTSDRISINREILHGKPHITGTRITVTQILDLLAAGRTIDDLLSADYFPTLSEADIRACLAFASQIVQTDSIVPTR